MPDVIIADLVVQTNCDKYEENQKWLNSLTTRYKAQAKQEGKILKRDTVLLESMCIISMDLEVLNPYIESRILSQLGYKKGAYKTAKLTHSVQVIEILNVRSTRSAFEEIILRKLYYGTHPTRANKSR